MAPVLVVDDDEATCEAIGVMLGDEHYDCIQVNEGARALAALRASSGPLVMLLDLDMPRLSGEGVLEAIAGDQSLASRVACIVLSAVPYGRMRDATTRFAALGIAALAKPFDMDDLLAAVARAQLALSASGGH